MNTGNSKTNESNKFIYQFTDKRNLKNPNIKNIELVNLSILKWWNDEFELPNGPYSISDIQNYFEIVRKFKKRCWLR